jgi:hypothetical protein
MLNNFRCRNGSNNDIAFFAFNDTWHKSGIRKREFGKDKVILAATGTFKNRGFCNWIHGVLSSFLGFLRTANFGVFDFIGGIKREDCFPCERFDTGAFNTACGCLDGDF